MKSLGVKREVRTPLRELLEEARAGDRQAFERVIEAVEGPIMKTALYMTGNLEDARDVAQEVYIRLVRHLEDTRELEHPGAWIYRVTVNAARDLRRRRRRWLPLKRLARSFTPSDPVEAEEFSSRLLRLLDRLSFRERAVFIFRQLHGMSTPEVAALLGIEPVTVRGYLSSGRRKLGRWLEDLEENS